MAWRWNACNRKETYQCQFKSQKAHQFTAWNTTKSATNLIQYLALRNEDIRVLQDKLHQAGLSSLASSESHILKQVQSIREILGATLKDKDISQIDYYGAQNTLNKFATELFGFKKILLSLI